jgi:drug/metabolite transporter (DMT)-like permease
VPFPLIAAGERHVASSLAAIIVAAVPLIIALLALRFEPSERVDRRRLIGLLVGFAGVIALVGIDVAGRTDELLGAGAILLAAGGYACGPMILNRHLADLDPRAMMAAALAMAALVLAPAAALGGRVGTPSLAALISVAVLVVFCTAAAFLIFVRLVTEVGPGRAAVITYVAPVLAVGLGVAVLGEHPGAGAIAGLLLILAGSWLATGGRLPPGVARLRARSGSRGAREPAASGERTIEALRA